MLQVSRPDLCGPRRRSNSLEIMIFVSATGPQRLQYGQASSLKFQVPAAGIDVTCDYCAMHLMHVCSV